MRLAAPRALVEGDELELVGIVHNLAQEGATGAENAAGLRRPNVAGSTRGVCSLAKRGRSRCFLTTKSRSNPGNMTGSKALRRELSEGACEKCRSSEFFQSVSIAPSSLG